MVVRLRFSRFGCKNRPFYRVMAADSRSPRDGKHLEVLGYYNPLPGQDGGKRMGLKFDRVKYWLSVGAQPSEPVQRLLFRTGLLPPPPMLAMGRKGGPRDTRPIDPMTGRYLTPNKPATDDRPKESEGDGDGDEDSGSARIMEELLHVAFDCETSSMFSSEEAALCVEPFDA